MSNLIRYGPSGSWVISYCANSSLILLPILRPINSNLIIKTYFNIILPANILKKEITTSHFTFMGPCIVNVFNYNQQDATLHNDIYYYNCSTCFRKFLRPSSGAQNCIHSIWYLSIFFCFLPLSWVNCQLTHDRGKKQKKIDKYQISVYTVLRFWWWAEELPETCRSVIVINIIV